MLEVACECRNECRKMVSGEEWQGFFLPVAAIGVVFVMLIPIPSFVLDLLLAASITASVIVFLTAVQVRRAVIFLSFQRCYCC